MPATPLEDLQVYFQAHSGSARHARQLTAAYTRQDENPLYPPFFDPDGENAVPTALILGDEPGTPRARKEAA